MNKRTSNISSEQLMHFVKKLEYLVEILNHNFYPRLCIEEIEPFFKDCIVYVPMKCFCDIPINCIQKHMKTYGEYGIGFKKSWGIRAGITPVIYFNKESPYVQYIRSIYNDRIEYLNSHHIEEEIMGRSKVIESIVAMKSSFTMYKPIYGKYERANDDNYCFYDEREWRYIVPADKNLTHFLCSKDPLDKELIDDLNGKGERKGKFEIYNQIEFTYDDIEFVIVPDESIKDSIVEKLSIHPYDIEKLKPKFKTIDALLRENQEE